MNTTQSPKDEPGNIASLHDRAAENLWFIRETMARAAPLTVVSGWGTVAMGVIALLGASVAGSRQSVDGWIYTWLIVACAGCLTGFGAMYLKARRGSERFWSQPGRRFAMSLFPPIVAGLALTEALYEVQLERLMPGVWLLLYGTGVVTGGAFSVKVLPIMGACFMALGTLALIPSYAPPADIWGNYDSGDLTLALGFGGLHIVFGLIIAWRYGG